MTGRGERELRLPALPGGPVPWVVAGGLVALALLTVVTASTPVDVLSQPRPGTARSMSLPVIPTSSTTPTPTPSSSGPFDNLADLPSMPPVVVTLIQFIVGGLLLWAIALLLRVAWQHTPRMRTRVVTRRSLQALPAVPDELLDTAEARMALLREGSPRNAIVACWVDLEDAASAAGLPRHPHETSAEYTVRVLKTWDIAPTAMGGLAELYREARYSRHPLTEAHRNEALARLGAIHDDLHRVVAEAQAEAELEEAARAARIDPAPAPTRTQGDRP